MTRSDFSKQTRSDFSKQSLRAIHNYSREFLLREKYSRVPPCSRPTLKREYFIELVKAFPKILMGKKFIRSIRLNKVSEYGALALRIDAFTKSQGEHQWTRKQVANLLVDAARAVDSVCKVSQGIWGLADRRVFGCVFPGKDQGR